MPVRIFCLLLLAACGGAPLADRASGTGEPLVVYILDPHFVRVDGARQPWEELVYDMRQRCRECRAEGVGMPWIEFRVLRDSEITPAVVERIQAGLREAGVQRIAMEVE